MKEYVVYERNGYIQVVPKGFNIWALLFGVIYYLYKGLFKYSFACILIIVLIYFVLVGSHLDKDTLNGAMNVVAVVCSIGMGIQANTAIEENLISQGFKRIGIVKAISIQEAYMHASDLQSENKRSDSKTV